MCNGLDVSGLQHLALSWIEVEVIIVRDQAHIGAFADYEADYADDCGSGHADFRGIEFTKVVQMFYPFSLQTHPHSFPGKATYVRIPQLKRRRKDTQKDDQNRQSPFLIFMPCPCRCNNNSKNGMEL